MSVSYISDARRRDPRANYAVKLPYRSSLLEQYYVHSRNIPHTKVVRHIKGLNDALICCVRDTGLFPKVKYNVSQLILPEREFLLRNVHPSCSGRGLDSNLYPVHTSLGLPTLQHRERGLPQASSRQEQLKEKTQQFSDRTRHCGRAEGEPLRKNISSAPNIPSSRARNRHSEHRWSRSSRNHAANAHDLDYEFNVLAKLCAILQTDSLTDVQHWLQTASIKEKEDVTEMLYYMLDMESSNQQDDEARCTKENLQLANNVNVMKCTEAKAADSIQHTRPASRIIEAKMNRKQEKRSDSKEAMPACRHLGGSRCMNPPRRLKTQQHREKQVFEFNGKVPLSKCSLSGGSTRQRERVHHKHICCQSIT